MPLIRCTQRLLKELGTPKAELVEEAQNPGLLGAWYATLFRVDRRKCILFTNAKTLYAFVVPAVRKDMLRGLEELFCTHLEENLRTEGFPNETIRLVLDTHRELQIGKTKSRSVLGSMNDYAYQFEYYVAWEGGLMYIDAIEVNKKLNIAPMSAIGYSNGIRELKRELEVHVT